MHKAIGDEIDETKVREPGEDDLGGEGEDDEDDEEGHPKDNAA